MEAILKAIISKRGDDWILSLVADSHEKVEVLNKLLSNCCLCRDTSQVLILWEGKSCTSYDAEEILFEVTEGPDLLGTEDVKKALKLMTKKQILEIQEQDN